MKCKNREPLLKKDIRKENIIERNKRHQVDSFLNVKSEFAFKKGISDKTRVVTHDYTGMLEIDRGK